MLCSEILDVHLRLRAGRESKLRVKLEEIWSSGALLRTNARIREATCLRFVCGGCEFRGEVIARNLVRGLGYFVELRFHPGCLWSEQKYRQQPSYNPGMNPWVRLANRIFEATLRPLNLP